MVIEYLISKGSINKINDFFEETYDFRQWFFKLKTYDLILENTDKFVKEFGDKELQNEKIEAYKLTLKAEIVFTFFHMAEALFSLMYYAKYSKIPWLFMKGSRFSDLCSYVKDEIATGKISDEDIRFIFFNGVVGKEAKKDMIVNSIKFIKEFLKKMASLFLDNEIYTEYKHGLRIMTKNAGFIVTPEKVPKPKPVLERSGTAYVFLQTKLVKKEGKKEQHKILQKTVSFDHELYLRLCIQILRLISNLFETRRQGKRLKPGQQMSIAVFDKEDIKEVFKENLARKFSFTIEHP